ncbi:unnamed protein product [Tenebrio molitor]|nr:unnamed protein product [Tenebrio molitor]
MARKVIIFFCLVLIILECTLAAPQNSRKEQDLKKSFVQFLQQDKELSALLGKINFDDPRALSRSIRQAEEDDFSPEQDVETTKQEGFFDRAAKFVMEVLQRFLKWVNSDN